MSSFSADWLTLREAADTRARSHRVTAAIARRLRPTGPIRILDLGAGTGANVRYLSCRLPQPQQWLLADQDAALLDRAITQLPMPASTRVVDLSRLDEHRDLFLGRELVTASALLDLVSDTWLAALTARTVETGVPVLFALSYDGRITCSPEEPEDRLVVDLVNRHQRTDKGFGPALGPDATDVAARLWSARGYEVLRERSDWSLASDEPELQQHLIEGWAFAAREISPRETAVVDAWYARRLEHIAERRSLVTVGHEDLAALPR